MTTRIALASLIRKIKPFEHSDVSRTTWGLCRGLREKEQSHTFHKVPSGHDTSLMSLNVPSHDHLTDVHRILRALMHGDKVP